MSEVDEMIKTMERINNNLNSLKSWHERYNGEVYCPFCGVPSGKVKTNGDGFYRCKGKCKNRFFLMICTED